MSERLAVLGLGMMGGSVAGAARSRSVASPVVGWDPNPKACATALANGLVDSIELTAEDAVSKASLVVAACPVTQVVPLLSQLVQDAEPGTLFTDLGSTKLSIVRSMRGVSPEGIEFLGSHPLAGSEKSGPSHADTNLLERKVVALCPDESSTPGSRDRLGKFWAALGARVVFCPAEEHDALLALTSHLPHLLAYLMAGMPEQMHAPFLAGGFRDMTRLAGSSPQLWMGIFGDNREQLLRCSRDFRDKLDQAIQALENPGAESDSLRGLIEKGWAARTTWQTTG